jgi:hypothetical protein
MLAVLLFFSHVGQIGLSGSNARRTFLIRAIRQVRGGSYFGSIPKRRTEIALYKFVSVVPYRLAINY